MPDEKGSSVSISIMGKEYQIACPPSEEEGLRLSAKYLNDQMNQIKSRGTTLGFEKVAIMAALNISHGYLTESTSNSSTEDDTALELKHIESKIDSALEQARQLEI